jgi:hypothetical protein
MTDPAHSPRFPVSPWDRVLGDAILGDESALHHADLVNPESLPPLASHLFQAMLAIRARGKTVEPGAVLDQLRADGHLDQEMRFYVIHCTDAGFRPMAEWHPFVRVHRPRPGYGPDDGIRLDPRALDPDRKTPPLFPDEEVWP